MIYTSIIDVWGYNREFYIQKHTYIIIIAIIRIRKMLSLFIFLHPHILVDKNSAPLPGGVGVLRCAAPHAEEEGMAGPEPAAAACLSCHIQGSLSLAHRELFNFSLFLIVSLLNLSRVSNVFILLMSTKMRSGLLQ